MSLWPIFDSLAPVFLLIALGAALRRSGFLSLTTLTGLNRLTYWIGLPCLTVHDIATGPFQPLAAAGLFTTVLVATVIGGVLAWYCAGACGAGRAARGTFVQAAFRGNLYFISLPVIVYASPGHPEVRSAALIASAPVILLYSIAAVLVLEASRSTPGAGRAGLWRSLATNPQLLACVIGLALAASGAGLPPSLERSLDALGRMALPLALLGIGG
ncbi:MAG TPA: AEC family transporter, partial [Plasticicumulans sp.]|nr:AEC family transporter [Plasticicumulans sp.]